MRCIVLLACMLLQAQASAQALSHGRFENVHIYRPERQVEHVVLFVSGDTGWNEKLDAPAQRLAGAGALVAGIDLRALKANLERDADACVSPDGDLENLGHFMQAYYGLPTYQPPVLIGADAGAAFVYAMLAQAPAHTFSGGISLEFCPELKLAKPLCESEHLAYERRDDELHLRPRKLPAPWIALASASCNDSETRAFIAEAGGNRVVPGKNDSEEDLSTQVLLSIRRIWSEEPRPAMQNPAALDDLPLIELPARSRDARLAVILSGDGGWAHIDKELAATFLAHGVAVVGLDSLRYFWKPHTPESTAHDVDRILRHYFNAWGKSKALLVGYSQGADVLPFIVNRLGSHLRSHIQSVALLAPGLNVEFEFHLSDWLNDDAGVPVLPEVRRIETLRVLCVYGADETNSLCREPLARNVRALQLPGGHHFDGNYSRIAEQILLVQ